uniref:Golgi membrane protein 1 n=1 Tax=Anabas testudineus TaxID=64144 RepID=A0A7N6ABP0_ANATE
MGGLGNGRRGGRSPPLMIGALIACVLVLGFNYWVSSSRNLDLQTKLYELEGQVRRGVAERSETEMKRKEDQKEILRQKEQISHLETVDNNTSCVFVFSAHCSRTFPPAPKPYRNSMVTNSQRLHQQPTEVHRKMI